MDYITTQKGQNKPCVSKSPISFATLLSSLFSIMGKSWPRTPEQNTYLESIYSTFLDAQAHKCFDPFYATLFEGWFSRWPEQANLFPDWKEGDMLDDGQIVQLGSALAKRKQVIHITLTCHLLIFILAAH